MEVLRDVLRRGRLLDRLEGGPQPLAHLVGGDAKELSGTRELLELVRGAVEGLELRNLLELGAEIRGLIQHELHLALHGGDGLGTTLLRLPEPDDHRFGLCRRLPDGQIGVANTDEELRPTVRSLATPPSAACDGFGQLGVIKRLAMMPSSA